MQKTAIHETTTASFNKGFRSGYAGTQAPIDRLTVSSWQIPTNGIESDGTLEWDATTLVLVEIEAGGQTGIGFTYADLATACFIRDHFSGRLLGEDALQTAARWQQMSRIVRNMGQPGVSAMAISAVDTALWDVKGRLLQAPLAILLGACRTAIAVYGSGGFTSYTDEKLVEQLQDWVRKGIRNVKMKVGREPERDSERVMLARQAIGKSAGLFVDANGAYNRQQALQLAEQFARQQVSWFEEPVSSDDLDGLGMLRNRAPAGMAIAAGEYGYDLPYFLHLLQVQAVDVLQADITRCGGVTGFMRVAALCEAFKVPLSCHCAPFLHLHTALAAPSVIHIEYFYDHARIETLLFDGPSETRGGCLQPDWSRPGLGLDFKAREAKPYAVS